jgi:hypothetical protein
VKASYANLPDGKFVIKIDNEETLCINLEKGKVTVKHSEEKADLSLSAIKATELLFSPFGKYSVASFEKKLPNYVQEWLPLPLYVHNQDTC